MFLNIDSAIRKMFVKLMIDDLFSKIVKIAREEYTEENLITTSNFLFNKLSDAVTKQYAIENIPTHKGEYIISITIIKQGDKYLASFEQSPLRSGIGDSEAEAVHNLFNEVKYGS